jgi:pilus assembly protein CpaB
MARTQIGKRSRGLIFVLGSIIAASATAWLVVYLLQNYQSQLAEANKPPELVSVVVAKRDLWVGLPITEEDIAVVRMVPEMVPGDLVFDDYHTVLRRVPRERILAHEPLRAERLAQQEAGIGLNAIIATGKRAMTVETDTESGLAGMLQPGNYIDVIVTIRPDDANVSAKWVTETILQGIRVLAVGSSLAGASSETESSSSRRRSRPSVTLELTLEESESLALASSKGDIHLVLRNDVDITQVTNNPPVTTATLVGFPSEAAPPPSPTATGRPARTASPETQTVEIIGDRRVTHEYPEDGGRVSPSGRN